MHELSLAGAIVDTAVKHARGRQVTAVYLRIGRMRQVIPETLEFYFAFVARGTACEDATLALELTAARLRCRPCALEWDIEVPAFRCPTCGGAEIEIVNGNEFQIESIEIEEPSCIA